jgi:hypothetical protein
MPSYFHIKFACQGNNLDRGAGPCTIHALTYLLHPNKNPVLAPMGRIIYFLLKST